MNIRYGTLYLADLRPGYGTEPGKLRPVLVVQTDLLNNSNHPSTLILPCTTRVIGENLLRVPIPKKMAGNNEDCEVMIDQIRAIDNRRFKETLKPVPKIVMKDVKEKMKLISEL